MIIQDFVFDSRRILSSDHFIYQLHMTNNVVEFNVTDNDCLIFVEISINDYRKIKNAMIGNKEIEISYYVCKLETNENYKYIHGFVVTKTSLDKIKIIFHKIMDIINMTIWYLDEDTSYYTQIANRAQKMPDVLHMIKQAVSIQHRT